MSRDMQEKTREQELGALWEKASARGTYLSGTIDGRRVVLFKNDRKPRGSKAPDWRVFEARAVPGEDS